MAAVLFHEHNVSLLGPHCAGVPCTYILRDMRVAAVMFHVDSVSLTTVCSG